MRLRLCLVLALLIPLAACTPTPHWELTSLRGHMPDLQFSLTNDVGQKVTAADYRGKVVMVYFGYTHCPDVCPLTLTHLHMAMQQLGKSADDVRILFVSVDPARDTPAILHTYVQAFDPRVVGLTGSLAELKQFAKRYRVAFDPETPQANGQYDVTHSSAIFVFNQKGQAAVLATSADGLPAIVHDLTQILGTAQ
ncbi:MAG: SCO family protein [Xanthomonadales bacterium]|nr:SCO family protein [Xanthomonadales bacterium]